MFPKLLLIARHEFISTLQRRSALFAIFGLPILVTLLLGAINFLAQPQVTENSESSVNEVTSALSDFVFEEEAVPKPTGLVDETGEISVHALSPQRGFMPVPDRKTAETLFNNDEIAGYYVVPTDFLETGDLFFYADTLPLSSRYEPILYEILLLTFLDEATPRERILHPVNFTRIDISNDEATETDFAIDENFGIGYIVAILFYITVIGSSGYLLQSLGKEKQNRVMEILLSSTRPRELLLGKVIGLSGIGLLQLMVWSLIVTFTLGDNRNLLMNLTMPTLTSGTWLLIILHFATGYFVYANIFAMLGAITPGPKESSQYTFFVVLPTFIPLWFGTILFTTPNATSALIMSLFPLTSPIAMPMRLAITSVPTWQWIISLIVSVGTAMTTLWLATQLFRSRILLSGQSLSFRTLWQSLKS